MARLLHIAWNPCMVFKSDYKLTFNLSSDSVCWCLDDGITFELRCYEIMISVLCLSSPDLFTYAVNGCAYWASGRWGPQGRLSWKETLFSASLSSQMCSTTSTPTGLMHWARITPLALEAVLKCLQLCSEDDWPTSAKIVRCPGLCVTATDRRGDLWPHTSW